ncbi:GNAT family N-acetyltransferase [Rosenbergiella collisarenosi]|uniref:GNAT family N-acetyltransferase n=1 Tax=Rosenbergiella collisarenosi TaxID=1544695 RepID=UPI001F4F09EA
MSKLTIELFSDSIPFDFSNFDCGEPSLSSFLKNHLTSQHQKNILRGYILRKNDSYVVLGYYTLSGSHFEREYLPSKTQQKKIPYSTVPSITIGRLAVDKAHQGKRLGDLLVTHAMRNAYNASLAVGVHALFVEALNIKAVTFYQKLGFKLLTRKNATANDCLFYPISGIKALLYPPKSSEDLDLQVKT